MTLREIIEQLEACNFECEAGPLELNVAFIKLKKLAGISDVVPKRKTGQHENHAFSLGNNRHKHFKYTVYYRMEKR